MRNETKFRLLVALILGIALMLGALAFAPSFAVTTFDAIRLRGIVGTATPVLQIDSRGIPMELRVNSTPVFKVDGSGISNSGDQVTFDDKVLIDGSTDAHQLTVQGYTTQTNNLLVLENSGGTDQFVVDGSGNVTTMGQFDESVFVDGEADEVQLTVSGYTTQTNSLLVLENSGGTDQLTVGNTGNLDTQGTVNFGSDDLYALGIASASQEVACATTSTFTGSTNITTTAVTTPTYILATQVTAPITTAAHLYVNDPTGITVTLTSLNSTFGAGTTGIAAHYCVVGTQ